MFRLNSVYRLKHYAWLQGLYLNDKTEDCVKDVIVVINVAFCYKNFILLHFIPSYLTRLTILFDTNMFTFEYILTVNTGKTWLEGKKCRAWSDCEKYQDKIEEKKMSLFDFNENDSQEFKEAGHIYGR